MNHIALKFEFETDKFRLTGELPEEVNAGNRFYGEDFAQWICKALPSWNLDYLDEDWGWEVLSTRGTPPENTSHRICVYAYPDDNQTGNYGSWMLILHSEEKKPFLWVFSRWKPKNFDTALGSELVNVVRTLGVHNLRSTVIHLDAAGNERKEEPFNA